jgi:hypothetical protein
MLVLSYECRCRQSNVALYDAQRAWDLSWPFYSIPDETRLRYLSLQVKELAGCPLRWILHLGSITVRVSRTSLAMTCQALPAVVAELLRHTLGRPRRAVDACCDSGARG